MSQLPDRIRTRHDVERLLASATNYEQRAPDGAHAFDLTRTERLLAALGDPQRGPTTLHIAGSKGKGSTARMAAEGLRAAGRGPVGLYTSPHLTDLTERIALDGSPTDEATLARALDRLLPLVRAAAGGPDAPTFFELLTAAAWWIFRERGCASVVLETGLGGRLDATTVCQPAATAITTIELEHTQILGTTLEAIAGEKAGILKRGVPCVTGATGAALRVIEERAAALEVPLEVLGREIVLSEVRTTPGPSTHARVELGGAQVEHVLPVAGVHQAANAALALALLRLVGVEGALAARALGAVRLPAALEPFEVGPTVVLDGAHTPASAAAAREALRAAWPAAPFTLLLAVLADKQVEALLAQLLPGAHAVVVTQVGSPRALAASDLARAVNARAPTHATVEPDARVALEVARRLTPPGGVLLVTGSLYLAGALRPLLERELRRGATSGRPPRPLEVDR